MYFNIFQILFVISFAAAITFLILYVQSRKAYKILLKKNLQEREDTFSFSDNIDFENITTESPADRDMVAHLRKLLEEEKVYLQPELTINDLAKRMGTNRTTLSRIINQYFQKSFPALLNHYRVDEALRLLTDHSAREWKLEVIGEMCGYRNRQVFHSAFKRETGITPNHFRKISRDKE